MSTLIELFNNLTSPEWIMQHGGLYFVLAIVFAETGLFIGFFLPGDTLLFIAGMMIANAVFPGSSSIIALLYWIAGIAAAGIAGNYVGYWFGRRSGGHLLQRESGWLFKKRHLMQAKEFYEKKGGGAIVLARFLPIVRTFAPIVAGIVGMNKATFTIYNILGSFLWVGSLVGAGYLLGDNAWAQHNLEKIILIIVVLSTTPVVLKLISKRKPEAIPVPVPQQAEQTEAAEHRH